MIKLRLKEEIVSVDYEKTKTFFKNRADRYKEDNPYSVTMYQDNNQELIQKRNKKEIEKLYPCLKINPMSRILDVACGIGRWADAIDENVNEYCGVDFCEELIDIARKRNKKNFVSFYSGSVNSIKSLLKKEGKGQYNVILMMGILVYLNDNDLPSVFNQINDLCEGNAIVCIREPVGICERLTLKDFYSEELNDNYNAIYRTRNEITMVLESTLLKNGFEVKSEGFLFEEDKLNNRKETSQYFFILERNLFPS